MRDSTRYSIQDLLEIPGNADSLRQLVDRLGGSLVPFVGAGLSMSLGYPGWGDFLQRLAGEFSQVEETGSSLSASVAALLEQQRFEEAADCIIEVTGLGAFHNRIRATFSAHALPKDFHGAVTYLPDIAKGPVITTNFDRIIEDTFSRLGRGFDHVLYGSQAERAIRMGLQRARFLVKLHGDRDEATGRILTGTDYDDHYGEGEPDLTQPLPILLRQIASSHSILFLGCSLSTDRTLKVIGHTAHEVQFVPHFAVVPQVPGREQARRTIRLETELLVNPIWYPENKHEYVDVVLRHLADEMNAGPTAVFSHEPEPPEPAHSKLTIAGIYGGLLLALAAVLLLAFRPALFPPADTSADPVRVCILQNPDQDEESVREGWGGLFDQLNQQLRTPPGAGDAGEEEGDRRRRDYQIRTDGKGMTGDALLVRTMSLDMTIAQIAEGFGEEFDILGPLSPVQLYEAYQATKAVPFISPQWDNSGVYAAVFVVSDRWVWDLENDKDGPGRLTEKGLEEARRTDPEPEDSRGEDKIDNSIKPELWARAVRHAVEQRGQFALMSQRSTSGHWYPRKLLLNELNGEMPFRRLIAAEAYTDEADLLQDVAGKNQIFAGALAEFQLKRLLDKPELWEKNEKDEYVKVRVVQRIPMIPQGAFVISRQRATDRRLLKALKETWDNASSEAYKVDSKTRRPFPQRWAAIDLSQYQSAFDVREADDPATQEPKEIMARFIISGMVILVLLCVTATVQRRKRASSALETGPQTP